MDNYATHKHPKVKAWLADHPRVHVHFTPTSGSWLNLIEVWFGIIEKQAIHRGSFHSWNQRSHPFIWTKPADQIHRKRNRTSTTAH